MSLLLPLLPLLSLLSLSLTLPLTPPTMILSLLPLLVESMADAELISDIDAGVRAAETLALDVVRLYREVVSDEMSSQVGSWVRHAGLRFIEDTADDGDDGRWSGVVGDGYRGEGPSSGGGVVGGRSGFGRDSDDDGDGSCKADGDGHLGGDRDSATSKMRRSAGSVGEDNFENDDSDQIHDDDDESDAGLYLGRLLTHCSRNATEVGALRFGADCWDMLRSLIDDPRCLTRLDSRTNCSSTYRGGGGGSSGGRREGEELIRHHLSNPRSLNVVILGAGPVGLVLASALTELNLRGSLIGERSKSSPAIRVLVFENRADKEGRHQASPGRSWGRKGPYTRDWITDVPPSLLYGTIDPRVSRFLMSVHKRGSNVALPLKAIETLLLLSNRGQDSEDREGASIVKFLYDDYERFEDALGKVPNLVAFDATGHRLGPKLRRPHPSLVYANDDDNRKVRGAIARGGGGSSTSFVSVSEYEPDSERSEKRLREWHRVAASDLRLLRESGSPLLIANFTKFSPAATMSETIAEDAGGGDLAGMEGVYIPSFYDSVLYPLKPGTGSGAPYFLAYIKVMGFALTPTLWPRLMGIKSRTAPPNAPPLCVGDEARQDWCGPHFQYEMSRNYRPDITSAMAARDPPFAVRAVILNVTPEQEGELNRLIDKYGGGGGEGGGVETSTALINIPPWEILRGTTGEVLRINGVGEILLAIMDGERERISLSSLPSLSRSGNRGNGVERGAEISVFRYRPYVYPDPAVPGGLMFPAMVDSGVDGNGVVPGKERPRPRPPLMTATAELPLLRVGDSLLSGDVNASTGLVTHLRLIRRWQCSMWGRGGSEDKEGLCKSPPLRQKKKGRPRRTSTPTSSP